MGYRLKIWRPQGSRQKEIFQQYKELRHMVCFVDLVCFVNSVYLVDFVYFVD